MFVAKEELKEVTWHTWLLESESYNYAYIWAESLMSCFDNILYASPAFFFFLIW